LVVVWRELFCDESGANLEHGVGGPEMGSLPAPGFQRSSARFAVGSPRFRTGWRCRRRGRCRTIGRQSSVRRGSATVVLDRCGWWTARGLDRPAVFGMRCAVQAGRLRRIGRCRRGSPGSGDSGVVRPRFLVPRGGSRGPALGLRRCAQVRAPNLAFCEPELAGRRTVIRRRRRTRQAAARWVSEGAANLR
jgi:hypothetical protein